MCIRDSIVIMDATADIEKIASQVDFVFCAVDMKKDEIKALEEAMQSTNAPLCPTTQLTVSQTTFL